MRTLIALLLGTTIAGAQYAPPPSCILRPGSTTCIRDLDVQITQADETIRRIDRLMRQQDLDTLRHQIDEDALMREDDRHYQRWFYDNYYAPVTPRGVTPPASPWEPGR